MIYNRTLSLWTRRRLICIQAVYKSPLAWPRLTLGGLTVGEHIGHEEAGPEAAILNTCGPRDLASGIRDRRLGTPNILASEAARTGSHDELKPAEPQRPPPLKGLGHQKLNPLPLSSTT